MKWEADQKSGYLGWEARYRKTKVDGRDVWTDDAAQPLHTNARLDLHQALHESRDLMNLWFAAQQHPEVPAFAGGLLDGWPSYAADALGICRRELAAIHRLRDQEARQ